MNTEKENTIFSFRNFFNKNKPLENPSKKSLLIEEHKKFVRNKLKVPSGNLLTILSILPFILGFSQYLSQKFSSKSSNLFFEQNLPGLSIPTQKLYWDTFQYLIKSKNIKNSLDINENTKISWSDKNIILQSSKKNFLNQNNLIAYKKSQSNSNWERIFLSSYNTTALTRFYQNLDELPRQLETIFDLRKVENLPVFSEKLVISSSPNLKLGQRILKDKSILESKIQKQLIAYKSSLNTNVTKTTNINKTTVGNFYTKRHQFFLKEDFLNSEIRQLFLNLNIIYPNTNFLNSFQVSNQKIFNNNKILIKNNETQFLQALLNEIDEICLPVSNNLNRLMSDYQYPDMTLEEIINLNLQQNFSQISNLKILLPSSYLAAQQANLVSTEAPSYLIKAKEVLLKDSNQREIFYEGPGILLNHETGFDLETKSKTATCLRSWIETYLGRKNATKNSLHNFFGIFESPEYTNQKSPKLEFSEEEYLNQLLLFQNGLITNTSQSIIPFNRSFQVLNFSSQNWQNEFVKNFSSSEYNTILLPIIETRVPNNLNSEVFFGYKNSLDFEFIHPLNSIKNNFVLSQNQIDFSINGSNFQTNQLVPLQLSSGKYQKLPSLFYNNSQIFFTDIWEPITIESWLISAQIGFAFLVFKILKALADNYGQELLVYLLDLVALLGFLDDDLKQEIEILMGQREKGFRIISKTNKNFNNIGGIQTLLPEIVEIVWFLRNSGREFSISKTLPRGVLLTGPPGTGKTLLVQAIAGEAEIPVLALSGSSLLEPGESGALKLEILFQEARKIAPCIVFIDEMDTLAEKREQVLQNPMGADEILESLSTVKTSTIQSINPLVSNNELNNDELSEAIFAQQDMHKEKLRILMQFLVELDGIQGRDGVIVIGATNRPEMLDPAILRPGRFDIILDLGLPGPEKRREILKLYSENLGLDNSISWNYLIHRTAGYSAADLAGMMNQSTLNAILKNSHHTIETIEYGIDRITTIGLEKPQKLEAQKILGIQVAYYQAGKILLSALLEYHPPTLVTHLWPRRTNVRALKINENLQKYFFRFARRIELEHRVIGCYAGKAAEILFLQETFQPNNLSDLGVEDIRFAQNLINYMIQHWYFYSKKVISAENSQILSTFNEKEYPESLEKIPFLSSILETNEVSLNSKGEQFGNSLYSSTTLLENSIEQNPQKYFPTASWQYQISSEFEFSTRAFSDWYRLYLPDPQQTERNLEWTPPDEFYHNNNLTEKLTDSICWNEVSKIQIDYELHSLILQSFNKALLLLDQHREVLDQLAYTLLHSQILREPEVEKILNKFKLDLNKQKHEKINNLNTELNLSQKLSKSWGTHSRRLENYKINLD